MTLRQCMDGARQRLRTIYPDNEARWMVREIFHHLKGYTLADLMLKAEDEVSDYIAGKVESITDRLVAHEPLQYIFNETRFYGMSFEVTPATLIPRPETEELTDLIVKRWSGSDDLRVLDLCTGSGCIAIALARNLPYSKVTAVDISADALEVARRNAVKLKAKVDFQEGDVLTLTPPPPSYDIIVSNPPYVLDSEKKDMDKVVLDHEPHTALFVPYDDPLRFYRPIIEYAATALCRGGMAYFEINPLEAEALKSLCDNSLWSDVTLERDISGRYRFLILTRDSH